MTIGTNIICGSFTFTFHTPTQPAWASGGIENGPPKRTDDTESRGSFRCGFYFGFYRAHHHVSNERESRPASVLTASPALGFRGRFPRHRPRFSPCPLSSPVTAKPLLPARPGLSGQLA